MKKMTYHFNTMTISQLHSIGPLEIISINNAISFVNMYTITFIYYLSDNKILLGTIYNGKKNINFYLINND